MLPKPRRFATLGCALAAALLLAACVNVPTTSPTERPKPEPTPSPTLTAAPRPSPTAVPTASPTPIPTVAAFAVAPNVDADALFAVRDICANPEAAYELEYPEVWWTNTQIGGVPACSWFSPIFYEVPDPNERPPEIAIEIFLFRGVPPVEELTREESRIRGQPAVRLEAGPSSGASPDFREYVYLVQFGPTLEGGPNVIARTDTNMGGDYALNKAVLDRIMATMEFLGTIQ